MVTWRELISIAFKEKESGESWDDVVAITLTDEELDEEFEALCGPNGEPFTMWTTNRVYFPAACDVHEWVASVPRNPFPLERTEHVGNY